VAACVAATAAAQPTEATEATVLSRRTIDILTRITLARLRGNPDPTRTDFEVTARTLDLIRAIEPGDTDLLRRSIEAWAAVGDPDREIALVRELLSMDPADTFAQLRVALDGVARSQAADGRLAAYERLLGERGAALHPSVRSRLALDAALLARDNGDDRLYLEYLTLATTLDVTNKEAAALYAGNLLQLTTDPVERVDILCNVVLADPLDPFAYENLALELLQYGAYAGAHRAFQLSASINQQMGRQISEERIFDFALCEWNVQGPGVAITRLLKVLQDTLLAQKARRDAMEADGLDPGPEPPVLLPPRLQLLRLAIAASEKSEDSAKALEAILEEYVEGSDLVIAQLSERLGEAPPSSPTPGAEPASEPPGAVQGDAAPAAEEGGLTDEDRLALRTQIHVYRLQRLWAQLAAGAQLDHADAFLTELEAQRAQADEQGADPTQPPPLAHEVLRRYRGWLMVEQGLDADAEAILAPLVEEDHLARWAMGLLKEEQGLESEAAKHFAILARDQPTTAIGTTAFFRLKRLLNKPIIRSTIAVELDERMAKFAPWLEGMIENPMRFMAAQVVVEPITATIFDRPLITIEIRNSSRWPLGVGSGRPIPKRMLLAPRVRRGGQDASAGVQPFVALLSSRLRLDPASTALVEVHPLREDFGRVLDNAAGARVDARWQLLQNFIAEGEGFRPAPLTVTTQSEMMTRVAVDDQVSVESLIERIAAGSGTALVSDVLLAGSMILARSTARAMEDPQQDQERTMLASAIVSRLATMADAERTITLARCAELAMHRDPALRASIHEAVGAETSRTAMLAALIGLAWESDDPIIIRAQNMGDAEIERIATLLQESLRASETGGSGAEEADAGSESD
jgi:hypothetical protein